MKQRFRSSHFSFLVFGHFWQQSYENTKVLQDPCLHFARQVGKDRKKWKEKHATEVTKIPKTKRRKYRMNKTFVLILVTFMLYLLCIGFLAPTRNVCSKCFTI